MYRAWICGQNAQLQMNARQRQIPILTWNLLSKAICQHSRSSPFVIVRRCHRKCSCNIWYKCPPTRVFSTQNIDKCRSTITTKKYAMSITDSNPRFRPCDDWVGIWHCHPIIYRYKGVPDAHRSTRLGPSRHYRCWLVRNECWKKTNISINCRR